KDQVAAESGSDDAAAASPPPAPEPAPAPPPPAREAEPQHAGPRPAPPAPISSATLADNRSAHAHASPAVRRFARELGVDLGLVRGSARKGRITKEDVKAFTKAVMSGNRVFDQAGGFQLPQVPAVDFSKFGPVENRKLPRLKRLGAQAVHRSWITVPHVTQFDEADITELEEF